MSEETDSARIANMTSLERERKEIIKIELARAADLSCANSSLNQ